MGRKRASVGAAKPRRPAVSNPFEERDNRRQRRVVLNKSGRGTRRNVALARALSHRKREKAILPELKRLGKANVFRDRRFGEHDSSIPEEEKILARFKKLRSNRSLYDLSDTDVNGQRSGKKKRKMELTHLGQSLSVEDDEVQEEKEFKRLMKEHGLMDADEGDGSEDDDDVKLDATELMQRVHDAAKISENIKKSKREIMEEVVAKAKLFKMERQRQKEFDEEERDRLDADFREIMHEGLLDMRPTRKDKKKKEFEGMMERLKNGEAAIQEDTEEEHEEDEYDKTISSLAFEARIAASDRTLTPEEKAKRELEKLQEQQKDLEARMKGIVEEEDPKTKQAADEIFFASEEVTKQEDEEKSDEDGKEESDDADSIEEELMHQMMQNVKSKRTGRISVDERADTIEKAKAELPFVINVPESHVEFITFIDKHGCRRKELGVVLDRMRKCNSKHLKDENRQKLEQLQRILIDHVALLAERYVAAKEECEEEMQACFDGVFHLAREISDSTAKVFGERLQKMRTVLMKQLREATLTSNAGGDYGSDVVKLSRGGSIFERRKQGGHKVSYRE